MQGARRRAVEVEITNKFTSTAYGQAAYHIEFTCDSHRKIIAIRYEPQKLAINSSHFICRDLIFYEDSQDRREIDVFVKPEFSNEANIRTRFTIFTLNKKFPKLERPLPIPLQVTLTRVVENISSSIQFENLAKSILFVFKNVYQWLGNNYNHLDPAIYFNDFQQFARKFLMFHIKVYNKSIREINNVKLKLEVYTNRNKKIVLGTVQDTIHHIQSNTLLERYWWPEFDWDIVIEQLKNCNKTARAELSVTLDDKNPPDIFIVPVNFGDINEMAWSSKAVSKLSPVETIDGIDAMDLLEYFVLWGRFSPRRIAIHGETPMGKEIEDFISLFKKHMNATATENSPSTSNLSGIPAIVAYSFLNTFDEKFKGYGFRLQDLDFKTVEMLGLQMRLSPNATTGELTDPEINFEEFFSSFKDEVKDNFEPDNLAIAFLNSLNSHMNNVLNKSTFTTKDLIFAVSELKGLQMLTPPEITLNNGEGNCILISLLFISVIEMLGAANVISTGLALVEIPEDIENERTYHAVSILRNNNDEPQIFDFAGVTDFLATYRDSNSLEPFKESWKQYLKNGYKIIVVTTNKSLKNLIERNISVDNRAIVLNLT